MSHVFLALLLASAPPPQPSTGWARVQQLSAGTKISLTYIDGRSEDRVVEGASGSQLMLRTRTHPATGEMIPRDIILEIAIERRHRNPAGAIIGAVGGFVWGLSLSGLQCTSGGCAFGAGLLNAVLGAWIGHALSPPHSTREVIYQANRSA